MDSPSRLSGFHHVKLPEGKIKSKYHQLQTVQTLHIGPYRIQKVDLSYLNVIYLLETGLFPYLPISDIDLAVEKQHGVEEGTTSLPTAGLNDGRQQKSLVSWGFQRKDLMEIVTEKLNHPFEVRIHRKRLLRIGHFSYRHRVCV